MNLQTLKSKIEEFLIFLDVEKNSSENTQRAYESDLKQIVKFWEQISKKERNSSHTFESIIRRHTVSLFYKKISKTSLARKLSSVRSFLHFLRTQGIKINLNCKSPRLDKKLPTTLTVDEIFYLLDSIKHEDLPTKFPCRDKTIFELLYATGVRCSELVGIKLQDINLDERTIKIYGKGRKQRIVLFGSKALKVLKLYIKRERAMLSKNKKLEHLFLNCNGTRLSSRSVQRIFEMFRKFLKIDRKLTPHKIRHSFATHMLNHGANLRIIQELLGHKTLSSTEIYTHISNKQLSKMCNEKHPLNSLDNLVFDDGTEKC